MEGGGKLADLSQETMEQFNEVLPPHWSHNNPVDIIGDAGPKRYQDATKIAVENPSTDGVLVILTPQDMTRPTQTAEQLAQLAHTTHKPILASWMGGSDVAAGVNVLNRADIPTFDYPDTAATIFNYMWRYAYNLRGIFETPSLARRQRSGGHRPEARHRAHRGGA